MKTEFLLAAISHPKDRRTLIDSACRAAFAEKIVPRLTTSSLVLCEGYCTEGIVRPNSSEYPNFVREFGGCFGDKQPSFAAVDPRYTPDLLKRQKRNEVYNSWMWFMDDHARVEPEPTSHQDVVDIVGSGKLKCTLSREPSTEEKEYARLVYIQMRRFDRLYRERLYRAKGRHDFCVCVTGVAHSFRIAEKTGFPIEHLWFDGDLKPIDMLRGYATLYLVPPTLAA